jgi:hypothetical protein
MSARRSSGDKGPSTKGGQGSDASFDDDALPYKTYNYPDVLDHHGADLNALDRQSVRELRLMPLVATKLRLRDDDVATTNLPEINMRGRRIEVPSEDDDGGFGRVFGVPAGGGGAGGAGSEGSRSPPHSPRGGRHQRSQSSRQPREQVHLNHQRSNSLPLSVSTAAGK